MFKILGVKDSLRNFVRLAKPYLSNEVYTHDLKEAYRFFLSNAQPNVPRGNNSDICFLNKKSDIDALLRIFEEDSV